MVRRDTLMDTELINTTYKEEKQLDLYIQTFWPSNSSHPQKSLIQVEQLIM